VPKCSASHFKEVFHKAIFERVAFNSVLLS